MDRILSLFPKSMLAFLAIGGGILFIVLAQPPHSLCDSQIEVLNNAQKALLFKNPKSKYQNITKFEALRDACKTKLTVNLGGCYELFQGMKSLNHDLGVLTPECMATVGAVTEYRRALWQTVELMVQLAWGEAAPSSYAAKYGYLEAADLSLFCQLKGRIVAFYGEHDWEAFRERMMQSLPGAKDLPRNQVWDLSIFSENCALHP